MNSQSQNPNREHENPGGAKRQHLMSELEQAMAASGLLSQEISDTHDSGTSSAHLSGGSDVSAGLGIPSFEAGSSTKSDSDSAQVSTRPTRLLIGVKRNTAPMVSGAPSSVTALASFLSSSQFQDDVVSVQAMGPANAPICLVANVHPDHVGDFKQKLTKQTSNLIIEEDQPLHTSQQTSRGWPTQQQFGRWEPPNVSVSMSEFSAQFRVVDATNNAPVAGATVSLIGSLWWAQGVTNAQGRVTVSLQGESAQSIQSVQVRPQKDYWSRRIEQPELKQGQENVITVQPLSVTYPGFPAQETYGWGQKAMKLDQLAAEQNQGRCRGSGIKIGIIDSGYEGAHNDLTAAGGVDYVDGLPTGWQNDTIGHGSHVAGVIAGRSGQGGIRGFAPDAEIYHFKVFPGGMLSHLIAALQECVERNIDIVNMSLGMTQRSDLLQQAIQVAMENGVACIAAAGNSAGAVDYPARFPEVLAVSAIGQVGSYPEDSTHSRAVDGAISADGYFMARFTCFGNEINVCAPGVAVISTVPDNGYAVWDGTSMACPHVVGLAALILEHNRTQWQPMSGAGRVASLFQEIQRSCRSLGFDRNYEGAGLPDVTQAIPVPTNGSGLVPDNEWTRLAQLLRSAIALIEEKSGQDL